MLNRIKELDKELDGEISECVKEERFKPLFINDEWIGFCTWHEVRKDGKLHVFIDNMFIEPQYRNVHNLFFLRSFFREKYGMKYRFVFWHNNRKGRFFYCR